MLAAASCGLAAAEEPSAPSGPPPVPVAAAPATASSVTASAPATAGEPATAAEAAAAEAAAAEAAAAEAAASPAEATPAQDAAAPTAGADLVMWNAAPAPVAAAATEAVQPQQMSRLRRFATGIMNKSTAIAANLTRSAMRFLGTPYVFGGARPGGFDCSGYVQHVFAMLGMRLPRTADAQFDAAHRIANVMEPGDLVFFHTYAPGVSHVGIYLGNDKFIHSSSSHGVSIASLHSSYWAPRYLGAKRVFGR
jgi:cell wall-associated NlpC family hydrolase